ncbi:hypothetical protein ABW19_dt0205244 [Dactylella cylindrospora]|nr:hypothetical protein ABW19_dt0205244 [Dactylella cylindrospora]
MSSSTLVNGHSDGSRGYVQRDGSTRRTILDLEILNTNLKSNEKNRVAYFKDIHGDPLLLEERPPKGSYLKDLVTIFSNPYTWYLIGKGIITLGKGVGLKDLAGIVASLDAYGPVRAAFLQGNGWLVKKGQVEQKWSAMLHPPLSYLGDAFQHRTVDGSFNSVLHPHLGQAGAPYAKTVPAKAKLLGAQPDPGDIFDRLMARELSGPRKSGSGLSVMLIYHATIIIHDIFRTNDKDKNISDSSSYLDLSPLYGYDEVTCAKVRTGHLGLLHPDTFAENRLLRQPPGVCTYLVMYNRYHNYVARQLLRINENGRFSIPEKYSGEGRDHAIQRFQEYYWEIKDFAHRYMQTSACSKNKQEDTPEFKAALFEAKKNRLRVLMADELEEYEFITKAQGDASAIEAFTTWKAGYTDPADINVRLYKPVVEKFSAECDAAWKKLDDDLYGTARLITCGLYINISIHDYLRALMGFHQWNTTFTLDPRLEVDKKDGKEGLARGIGNQVSVEFNLLYRFHCAIGENDEWWMNKLITKSYGAKLFELGEAKDADGNLITNKDDMDKWDPRSLTSDQFNRINPLLAKDTRKKAVTNPESFEPKNQVFFDLNTDPLLRDPITNQFKDEKLIEILSEKMEEPIAQFGPRNIPRALRAVEVAGILQARKWEIGTLNDFREFFGMKRHETFESISRDEEVCQALKDLYEDVDKVEFYPGVFCEGGSGEHARDCDPGPQIADSTLWAAIFSDAVTLVRSDRFYTVDWNTNTLTSWGMKEVTADNNTHKSSVFHRLLQRAFPDWYEAESIRFFHPFYTTETNMKYAKEQGYGEAFYLPKFDPKNPDDVKKHLPAVQNASAPKKPNPTYKLTKYLKRENMPKNVTIVIKSREAAEEVIKNRGDIFVNPTWLDSYAVPNDVLSVLLKAKGMKTALDLEIDIMGVERDSIGSYFEKVAVKVIDERRQVFEKGEKGKNPVYQIDAVRDFAIPVITHYFADFLGFSNLIIGEGGDKFSTNEVYHHIVNVQNYLSYNVDETKRWKRREAFKKSAEVLLGFAKGGHIKTASSWWPLWRSPDNRPEAYMKELGYKVAQKLLKLKTLASGTDEAAAVMLLVALDSIFNAVLTFATSLAFFFDQTNRTFDWRFLPDEDREYQEKLHAKVDHDHQSRTQMPDKKNNHYVALETLEKRKIKPKEGLITWEQIQKVAFDPNTSEHDKDHEIMHFLLEAQRMKVKLPVLRQVVTDVPFKVPGSDFEFRNGDTVVVDVHTAEGYRNEFCDDPFCIEKLHTHKDLDEYLAYAGGFSRDILKFEVKNIPIIGLAVMFKVMGQMNLLRQGHDSQGRLKSINNSPSYGNLANRIAPKDLKLKMVDLRKRAQDEKNANKGNPSYIFESFDTQPESYTYLTPEWDETMPFPNTMKVRFNGYGEGVWMYGDNSEQSHGIGSLWTPQGPSHTGGVWAAKKCPCRQTDCKCSIDVKKRLDTLEKAQKDLHDEFHEHESDVDDLVAQGEAIAQVGNLLKSLGTPHSGCGM